MNWIQSCRVSEGIKFNSNSIKDTSITETTAWLTNNVISVALENKGNAFTTTSTTVPFISGDVLYNFFFVLLAAVFINSFRFTFFKALFFFSSSHLTVNLTFILNINNFSLSFNNLHLFTCVIFGKVQIKFSCETSFNI